MCEMYNRPVVYSGDENNGEQEFWASEESVEDKVILETEITLRTGPNITMKIHEESRPNSVVSGTFESEEDSRKQGVIKVLDDSESDFYEESRKTPRKVRFGGESVKLRTPESDSSHQADDDDISTIKITVTDAVSIKTRRSLIPIRITSLPSTPKRYLPYNKSSGNHYKSAPNLIVRNSSSRIPLREKTVQKIRKQMDFKSNDVSSTAVEQSPTLEISKTDPFTSETNKDNSDKENKQPSAKLRSVKHNRSANVLSPNPVHNEIEVFHNLTRSPERTRKNNTPDNTEDTETKDKGNKEMEVNKDIDKNDEENNFVSFKIYDEDENISKDISVPYYKEDPVVIEEIVKTESPKQKATKGKGHLLQKSLSSLNSEDEIWAKSEALHSLLKMLKQPATCESLEPGAAALLLEALFACHHRDRLHNLADDALTILVEGLRDEVLEPCLPRLALGICKMGASSGVRLALAVMKKLHPKKLQCEILQRGFGHRTREGALQVLMACSRLYPRSDVEATKIAEFASSALKDRRRRVRQAALETLAAIAQLTSTSEVLNVVSDTIKDFVDYLDVIQVVRTRLSRKQLPTVEQDGTIRYSSPLDQTETDWISGSILKKDPVVSSSPLSSASSSTPSVNYWMRNSRHENFGNGTTLMQPFPGSFEDDSFDDPTKIWAVDASSYSKNGKASKGPKTGVLRPVYILQPETTSTNNGGRGHRKYDRGRSFSPPKHQRGQFQNGQVESAPAHPLASEYVQENSTRHFQADDRLRYPDNGQFRPREGFRKSFSSDQLYFGDRLPQRHEPYSFSLSSRSSTTSTGSSTRSGFWHKDYRSGIPIPISSETKLKIRSSNSSNIIPSGPLIAKRSAITSPHPTPTSSRISPRDNDSTSHLSLPPPRSSGSESSGYFTPSPPDSQPAFIKMDTEERLTSDAEEPSSVNNNSRDCVDSYSAKSAAFLQPLDKEQKNPSISSKETNDGLGETINDNFPSVESINITNNNEEPLDSRPSSTSIVITETTVSTIEVRRKSKSVIDLQNFLPEINSIRKSVNSAPPRNVDTDLNLNDLDTTLDSDKEAAQDHLPSPIVIPLTSMDYSLQSPDREVPSSSFVVKSKLERRFSRNKSRKTPKTSSSPVVLEPTTSRPFSRPKEALHHVLAQMESSDWETTIQGLQGLTRIVRHNPEVIENQMHSVCLGLSKHVKNLRSQVARTACSTAGELFLTCRRGLDTELEEIACPLLQRTADTNRFLRADANAALDVMCEQLPAHRVISVVTQRGCGHQNAVVRAAALRLLGDVIKRLGADRFLQMPKEIRDKLLLATANSLTDGNVDARSHGKTMFRHLIGHPGFPKTLNDAVPQHILRHISKTLSLIKPAT